MRSHSDIHSPARVLWLVGVQTAQKRTSNANVPLIRTLRSLLVNPTSINYLIKPNTKRKIHQRTDNNDYD